MVRPPDLVLRSAVVLTVVRWRRGSCRALPRARVCLRAQGSAQVDLTSARPVRRWVQQW